MKKKYIMGTMERIVIKILVRIGSINMLTIMNITDFMHMKTVLMKDVEIVLKDVETALKVVEMELKNVETALKDMKTDLNEVEAALKDV